MKHFAHLLLQLDETTKTNNKIQALVDFFNSADDQDKIWALALLCGRKPKRQISTKELKAIVIELCNIPEWLFEESYQVVGDMAETIALLLPDSNNIQDYSLNYWIEYLENLKHQSESEKKVSLLHAWDSMLHFERFVFNKLITGGFRIGVSQSIVIKAVAQCTKLTEAQVAHRISGNWSAFDVSFSQLIDEHNTTEDISKPYPFYLAYALENDIEELGDIHEWQIEWKWDGIRGQLIHRNNELFVWSRGEELITDRFPEFLQLQHALPGGIVLDGEILPYKNQQILSFQLLQTRISRKSITKKILQEAPCVFMVYDVLEYQGKDIREQPLSFRRAIIEELAQLNNAHLLLSPLVNANNWQQIAAMRLNARNHQAEGFMLKRKNAAYKTGRKKGDWWKWKTDPLTVDAVLVYAQKGHGRRANLYTDYTFAIWQGDKLVPFTKAYSGLTDDEFKEVDRFIKQNTLEKFGPVRTVKPELVFEIAFEGIQESSRHKSGIALRFPRMSRWRKDKPASEADTLENVKLLLK